MSKNDRKWTNEMNDKEIKLPELFLTVLEVLGLINGYEESDMVT